VTVGDDGDGAGGGRGRDGFWNGSEGGRRGEAQEMNLRPRRKSIHPGDLELPMACWSGKGAGQGRLSSGLY